MTLGARGPRLAGALPWPESAAERYRSLGLWQGQTLSEWLAERAERFAERIAVVDGAERVSYRELAQRVEVLARGFHALGLGDLERVVVQLPNGVALLETLFAVARLGAVPVLALPAHRAVELGAFCARASASVLVLPERHGASDMRPIARTLLAEHSALRNIVVHGNPDDADQRFVPLTRLRDGSLSRGVELPAARHCSSDVLLLQLSGGSTGVPKLIPRTHDDYLYSVRQSAEVCELDAQTRFLAALPMTHNFTLSSPGVLGALHVGGTVVACPHPSPDLVFSLLEGERVTLAAAVPSLVRAWVDAKRRCIGERQLGTLTLQVGGAKLEESLALAAIDTLGCKLQQVFGMAEGLVSYTRPSDPLEVVTTTQGRPMSPYDELRIVDPDAPELEVPDGAIGELQTRGPYTIVGYYEDRSTDARHFTTDGFYRTGDLVRRTPAGNLVVEGRIGERILRGGEKIAPIEVEEHLLAHPAIRDAAVVGAPDVLLGQRSHVFVVLADVRATLSTAEARRFLRERGLAEFKFPDVVHVLSEMPRTHVGKTDKKSLRARLETLAAPSTNTV